MSVGTYKPLGRENYFAPSFSLVSTHRSSNVPIFSTRRNMSKSTWQAPESYTSPRNSQCVSERRFSSRNTLGRSIFDGITNSIYDSGKFIWHKLVGTPFPGDDGSESEGVDELNRESVKRLVESDPFRLPSKRRLVKENSADGKTLGERSETHKEAETLVLHFSKDPFNWNDWETSEIGPQADEEDAEQVQQYGTSLIRRGRQGRFARNSLSNSQLTLRTQSDEVNYLKRIYNGQYQVPEILEEERENQLSLLQKDRDSHLKKTIVDLTQRIKNILSEREASRQGSENDITIVRERKIDSLERKRSEFQRRRRNIDRVLHQLEADKEFKTYRQLIEERKQIQEEVRKKKDRGKEKKLVPDVSQNEANNVKKMWGRNDNAVLSNRDNLEVTVRDFKTLTPRRWLNDTVIEFFMKQIEKNNKRIVAFNSFFYTSLSERGYQGVRRWMKRKKVQINDLDKIFVPVNLNQSHWALGMIDIVQKRILYVDSLSNGPNAMSFAILSDLQNYVIEESKNTIGSDFELANLSCPQQPNGFDCGIYLCMNTLYLSQNAPLSFDQRDAVRMRTYIAHLILSKDK